MLVKECHDFKLNARAKKPYNGFMGKFEEEYKNLNSQQKCAVDSIDGPVLVVAGPGTGKTQLLSMRTANILKKTDTSPQSVLCLTFTNKAAINMKERLLRLTDGGAKNVMIKTFHGFAAEIMNLYPEHFWNGARLITAPDTVQNEIILSILSALPLDDPLALKFAGQFTAGKDVKSALQLAKEAGLTPEKLKALIEANLAYIDIIEPELTTILTASLSYKKLSDLQQQISTLPDQGISASLAPLTSLTSVIQEGLDFAISQDDLIQKTTNTGKWKQSLVQSRDGKKGMFKERERNNWWLSLANVYAMYRQELHKRGFYDYSDMLVEAIAVLEQNDALRSDIQERFQYVLIDEFQDSNAAQMRLAHLVADHESNLGQPNLMAVGDDDQSIYKFNGAELANMLTFKKSYPSTELIVLTDNYRSSQAVLDSASRVIKQASDRLTLRDPSIVKNIVAKNPPKTTGYLIHKSYSDQATQLHDISLQIAAEYSAGNHSIAVLARNNDSLRRIASNLQSDNIPLSYQEQNNILDHQLVITVYQISAILLAIEQGDAENVNYLLSQILRHPMWQINPYDLWQFAVANRRKSWLSAMKDAPAVHQFFTIQQWLLWLSNKTAGEPLPIIIEYITGLRSSDEFTSPLQSWYSKQTKINTDYLHGLSALKLLLGLVNEFARLDTGKLQDFVNFIEVSKETGQIIADESSFVTDDNAVELLTIHKAKGLEFDSVYIIDAIDNNWRPRTSSKRSPINLPLQPAFDDMDDYIRLMYVAMTRARHSITVSSFKYDEKGQSVLATPLIENILPEDIVEPANKKEVIGVLEQTLSWPKLSIDDEKQALKPRLENFQLSASSLLDFLDVSSGGPEKFKENHLLSLPSSQNGYMGFGTAVHSALELAQILVNKKQYTDASVIKRFEQNLKEQNMPKSDYERFLDHGKNVLQKLLKSDTFYLPNGSLPEQSIADVRLGDARLYGKLDRVDIDNNELTVVDYKTGKPLPSLFTKDQSKAIKAWRHRTQLAFYCLLAKNSSRFGEYKTFKGQILYVEASNPKELIREYTPSFDDIQKIEKLICAVWELINNQTTIDIANFQQNYEGVIDFENYLLSLN